MIKFLGNKNNKINKGDSLQFFICESSPHTYMIVIEWSHNNVSHCEFVIALNLLIFCLPMAQ